MINSLEIECNSKDILDTFSNERYNLESFINEPCFGNGKSISSFIGERAKREIYFSEIYLRNILDILKFSIAYCKIGHKGQLRKTNEPYHNHPIAATKILAPLGVSYITNSSMLLHDIIEEKANEDIKKHQMKVTDINYHMRFLSRMHEIGIDYYNFITNHITDDNKEIYYRDLAMMLSIVKHISRRGDKNYLSYLYHGIFYPRIEMDFHIGDDNEGISSVTIEPFMDNFKDYYGNKLSQDYWEFISNIHLNKEDCRKVNKGLIICKEADIITNLMTMPKKDEATGLGFTISKRLYELFKGILIRHETDHKSNIGGEHEDYNRMMALAGILGKESIKQLDSDIYFLENLLGHDITGKIKKEYNRYRKTCRWDELTLDGKSIFDKTLIRYVGYLSSKNEDTLLHCAEQRPELLYQDCLAFKGLNNYFNEEYRKDGSYPVIKGFLLEDLRKHKAEDIAQICGFPFNHNGNNII